jgi:hypothetical protein
VQGEPIYNIPNRDPRFRSLASTTPNDRVFTGWIRQIELFDGVTPTQMPAWRDLPEETRGTLTGRESGSGLDK